jgi:hypothetical protein
VGLDGYERSAEEEARLNVAAATLFGTAAGKEFMDYLRSISIERVSGPNIDDGHLRHLEGMRFIVAIISQRIAKGHKHNERSTSKGTDASPSTPGGTPAPFSGS